MLARLHPSTAPASVVARLTAACLPGLTPAQAYRRLFPDAGPEDALKAFRRMDKNNTGQVGGTQG
jgi:hypothetical protein